jgi:hypothetical protein
MNLQVFNKKSSIARYLYLLLASGVLVVFSCMSGNEREEDQPEPLPRVLLSEEAGDRATAYTMSNKIIRLPEGLLCTWIDAKKVNKWAIVSFSDGKISKQGVIGGPRYDNHCGAALAITPDGSVHAVLGGHHSDLDHYQFKAGALDTWEHICSIESLATYPCLVSDKKGMLHLTYRSQRGANWTLDYCTFDKGRWSTPKSLVQSVKEGYIFWTNTLAVGPENRLHLAFARIVPLQNRRQYHGAAYIFSDDQGKTWLGDATGIIRNLPTRASELIALEGRASKSRIAAKTFLEQYNFPGPASTEYLQMVLSNLVVDPHGIPHILYHNGIEGTVELMSYRREQWESTPIMNELEERAPGYRVHMQSSLTVDEGGLLHAGVMMEPTMHNEWGPNGTITLAGSIDPVRGEVQFSTVTEPDSACAVWLPAYEQSAPVRPAILLTKGQNAGGFSSNQNELKSHVILLY